MSEGRSQLTVFTHCVSEGSSQLTHLYEKEKLIHSLCAKDTQCAEPVHSVCVWDVQLTDCIHSLCTCGPLPADKTRCPLAAVRQVRVHPALATHAVSAL